MGKVPSDSDVFWIPDMPNTGGMPVSLLNHKPVPRARLVAASAAAAVRV